jgi:small subunit ribosomal protein S8
MVSDPVGDFITRIKNANAAGKPSASAPYSKLLAAVAAVLAAEGFVGTVARKGKRVRRTIEVALLKTPKGPRVSGARRVSKLSRRVYYPASRIYPVRRGAGRLVLSTPKGVMTGEAARKARVGGEALFEIW